MAIAVAATVGGGKPAGVGSLGQLFQGPGIPPAAQAPAPEATAPGSGGLRFSPLVPPIPFRRPARPFLLSAVETTAPSEPTSAQRRRERSRRVAEKRPRRPGAGRTPESRPPQPPPGSPPPPAPPGQPDLVRGLGGEVSRVVRGVPQVGPPAADAVDTVIELLAPPPPVGAGRGAPPHAGSRRGAPPHAGNGRGAPPHAGNGRGAPPHAETGGGVPPHAGARQAPQVPGAHMPPR